MIKDIWEFYKLVDELAKKWEESGPKDFGMRLKNAKASGCTSGEILGEIGLVLKDYQRNQHDLETYELEVKRLLGFIDKAFER